MSMVPRECIYTYFIVYLYTSILLAAATFECLGDGIGETIAGLDFPSEM